MKRKNEGEVVGPFLLSCFARSVCRARPPPVTLKIDCVLLYYHYSVLILILFLFFYLKKDPPKLFAFNSEQVIP